MDLIHTQLTRLNPDLITNLKQEGAEFIVSVLMDGIMSEGDDVRYLFLPAKTEAEASEIATDYPNAYVISLSHAYEELIRSSIDNKSISFFTFQKYISEVNQNK